MKKRVLSLLLAVLIVLALVPPAEVRAAEIVASGVCGAEGSNVTWSLDSAGTLTISGTRRMCDYAYFDRNDFYKSIDRPWSAHYESIKKIVVVPGVASIGVYAFADCPNLETVELSNTVTEMGADSLAGCTGLKKIVFPESVTNFSNSLKTSSIDARIANPFEGEYPYLKSAGPIGSGCDVEYGVVSPTGGTDMPEDCIPHCLSLEKIIVPERYFRTRIYGLFGTGIAHYDVPEGIESIGDGTFYGCQKLKSISLPKTLKSIGEEAFNSCTVLQDVYYAGTQEEWEQVSICNQWQGNHPLLNATIHFEGVSAATPSPTPTPSTTVPAGWRPIYTLADLQNAAMQGKGQKMILMNNIDANQEDFKYMESRSDPYGVVSTLYEDSIFDGNGHTIYNLKTGVFVVNYGTLRNLNVTIHDTSEDPTHLPQSSFSAFYYYGLVDFNMGMIENCNVKMTVHRDLKKENNSSDIHLAGLVRSNFNGTIRNCVVDMDVDVRSKGGRDSVNSVYVAGLCYSSGNSGNDVSLIDHCLVMGRLQGTGDVYSCSALGMASLVSKDSRCVNSACALELLSLTTNNEHYFSPAFETWIGHVDGAENCRVASDIQLVHNVPDDEKSEFIGVGYTEDSRASILAGWDLSHMPGDTPVDIPTPTPTPSAGPTVPPDAEASGACGADGDNLVWWVKGDTLTISGTGEMKTYDFAHEEEPPWQIHADAIKHVVVEDGVGSISRRAFEGLYKCVSVTIGEVDRIEESAFAIAGPGGKVTFTGKAPRFLHQTIDCTINCLSIYYHSASDPQGWEKITGQRYYALATDQDCKLFWIDGEDKTVKLPVNKTWNFQNKRPEFANNAEDGHYILAADYRRLLSNLDYTNKNRIKKGGDRSEPNKKNYNIDGKMKPKEHIEWHGSCSGMSTIVAGVINGAIDPETIYGTSWGISHIGQKDKPLLDGAKSLINYYHFQQDLKAVRSAKEQSVDFATHQEQIQYLVSTIKDLESQGKVALIDFEMQLEDNKGRGAHAIVGFAVEEGMFPIEIRGERLTFTGRILTYDPTYTGKEQPFDDTAIYYNENAWCIPLWNALSTDLGIGLSMEEVIEAHSMGLKPQPGAINKYQKKLETNTAQLVGVTFRDTILNPVDFKTGKCNFNSSKQRAVPSSYLTVSAGDFTLQIGDYTEHVIDGKFEGWGTISKSGAIILANGESGGSYTVVFPGNVDCSVETDEDFYFAFETDDFYLSAGAQGAGRASFTPSGTVDLNVSGSAPVYASLTANNSPTWHNFEVASPDAGHLLLELTDNGLEIWGDGLRDANVTAYDQEEDAKQANFTASEGNVLVTDENEELVIMTDPDGDGVYDVPLEDQEPTPPAALQFSDVKPTDYFYHAVAWAVAQGITGGTSSTTFSPGNTCTREQIMTFLWAANGRTEPSGMAEFDDLPKNTAFQKAISWAVEKKITAGTGGNKFGSKSSCTRGQAMVFLWTAAGRPEPSQIAGFADMPDNSVFQKAISWAKEEGITSGTSATTFSPNKPCTRAQIMTFLYHVYQ